MNRTHNTKNTKPFNYQDLVKQTAFHEAGHAAAIYLYNKSNSLPPVFFQITTKELCSYKLFAENRDASNGKHFVANIEGGRLIENFSVSLIVKKNKFTKAEKKAYQAAYEADIVNLLVGPLTEAKYVALRDDEPFNTLLVNIDALKFYGGASDIKSVREYLNFFLDNESDREKKLAELFEKAYLFIENKANWKAISSLASYIKSNKNKTISCEEAFNILDKSVNLLANPANQARDEYSLNSMSG